MRIEVNLSDFNIYEIVEYIEEHGYRVFKKSSIDEIACTLENLGYDINVLGIHANSKITLSYDSMIDRTDKIKQLLQNCCYDKRFVRFMLTEIAGMPMCSDVGSVLDKIRVMCE